MAQQVYVLEANDGVLISLVGVFSSLAKAERFLELEFERVTWASVPPAEPDPRWRRVWTSTRDDEDEWWTLTERGLDDELDEHWHALLAADVVGDA